MSLRAGLLLREAALHPPAYIAARRRAPTWRPDREADHEPAGAEEPLHVLVGRQPVGRSPSGPLLHSLVGEMIRERTGSPLKALMIGAPTDSTRSPIFTFAVRSTAAATRCRPTPSRGCRGRRTPARRTASGTGVCVRI